MEDISRPQPVPRETDIPSSGLQSDPVDEFTPPAEPLTTPTAEPTKPKKRGLKALMIAIIAVATLGAAGTFAYLGLYVPNQPENVLKTAALNLMNAESAAGSGDVVIDSGGFSVTPTFMFAAAADGGASFSFNVAAPAVQFSGEIIHTNNNLYFKFVGLNTIFGVVADSAVAYGFDEEFVDYLGEQVGLLEDNWSVSEGVSDSGETTLSEEDKQAVIDALSQHDVFAVETEHNEELISGRDTRHFTVVLNKTELAAAINSVNIPNVSAEDKTKLVEAINEAQLNPVDVWVYKDTKEFAKFSYSETFDSAGNQGTVTANLTFTSFNQTDTIPPPVEAADIKGWWENVLNTALDGNFIDPQMLNPGGFSLPIDSIQTL